MIKLKIASDGSDMHYINIENKESDRVMANKLCIDLEEYVSILKSYNACQPYSVEYYFKSKVDAQQCVDHLNNMQTYKEYYEVEKTITKPSLGVMPKNLFEEQRILELSRALYEYINTTGAKDYALMTKWAEELQERIWNLKYMSEE